MYVCHKRTRHTNMYGKEKLLPHVFYILVFPRVIYSLQVCKYACNWDQTFECAIILQSECRIS
jgi:hypothetical protein